MPTTVVNVRASLYDVYIGRPSKWGNPFTIGSGDGVKKRLTREEVIDRFRTYWYSAGCTELRAQALVELKDQILGCWCHPKACHGDVIAEFVNREGA